MTGMVCSRAHELVGCAASCTCASLAGRDDAAADAPWDACKLRGAEGGVTSSPSNETDLEPHCDKTPGDGGMAEVRHFLLHEASLEEYADAFEASGYDDLAFLKSISAADFEVLSRDTAMKKGHAHKLAWKLGLRRDGGAYVRP